MGYFMTIQIEQPLIICMKSSMETKVMYMITKCLLYGEIENVITMVINQS